MRVLILTHLFDPEPAIKGLPFARALVAAGHEVQVVTGFPSYPGGVVYPGYRIRPVQHEIIDGIRVTRVAMYPSHDRSALRRVATYLSFFISATLAGLFSRFRPDVMYVYHPPLTVGVAAAIVSLVRGVPFVYDVQDLWPDSLEATGMIRNSAALAVVGRVADWVYRRAAVVVAQSRGFAARLIERGVPAEKVRVIFNWCDEAGLTQRSAAAGVDLAPLRDRFNVVFAGTMGAAQALGAVLDAAALVAARNPRVQFVFVGGGTEVPTLKESARNRKLSNVVFLPRMEMSAVGHLLDAADALLVHLRDTPLFTITLPSKTQAYLFAARPILMAVRGDGAAMVRESESGVCATPEDPDSIAHAVLSLAALPPEKRREMGLHGREYYDRHLSLAAGTRQMVAAFEQAIKVPA